MFDSTRHHHHRSLWRYLLTSGVLAFSLGMPIVDNPLTLPAAYAHHGGGGGGSSGGGSSGGGGGGEMIRKALGEGYGKGGRGFQGMKP
jgi:hypothetical protein